MFQRSINEIHVPRFVVRKRSSDASKRNAPGHENVGTSVWKFRHFDPFLHRQDVLGQPAVLSRRTKNYLWCASRKSPSWKHTNTPLVFSLYILACSRRPLSPMAETQKNPQETISSQIGKSKPCIITNIPIGIVKQLLSCGYPPETWERYDWSTCPENLRMMVKKKSGPEEGRLMAHTYLMRART